MLFRIIFRLCGWKLVNNIPQDIKKAVIAVIPHTTWIDFLIGLGARATMRRKIGYLGKAELFKPPFGFIFKCLGGTPVVRNSSQNMVESYALAIKNAPEMLFALAPEGTRKDVAKLRTGFYFMAHGGQIPIIPVGFDFLNKQVIVGEAFYTTGSFENDMKAHYVPFAKSIHGANKSWITNYEMGIFN